MQAKNLSGKHLLRRGTSLRSSDPSQRCVLPLTVVGARIHLCKDGPGKVGSMVEIANQNDESNLYVA